jgi:hypothetical protein
MSESLDPEFIAHLERTSGLGDGACRRLVLEVLAQYQETLDAYVQRRHQELRDRGGLKNAQIYQQILTEVPQQRFSAPQLTERQIRRMIYG